MDSEGGLASVQGIDRRKLLKRMAVAGGVVVGAPVILSQPASAMSTVGSAGRIRNVNPTINAETVGSSITLSIPVEQDAPLKTVTVQGAPTTPLTITRIGASGWVFTPTGVAGTPTFNTASASVLLTFNFTQSGTGDNNVDYDFAIRLRFSYVVGGTTYFNCQSVTYRLRWQNDTNGFNSVAVRVEPAGASC